MLLVNDAGDWGHVHPWLEHAAWHGCTPADFIFPFFLFIVGVSLGLSLMPRVAAACFHRTFIIISERTLGRKLRSVAE